VSEPASATPLATGDAPLWACIAQQADHTPDALALQFGQQAISYRQLITLAEATARQWAAEGLGAGDFIGWLGHNSPQMLAALLACARLGAVWVPLNWRLAAPELAAIAQHAGLSALKHTPELASLAGQVLALGALTGPVEAAQPGDVMLVYTSGTTGEPKGAMHSQAGMVANIGMALAVQKLTSEDRVLAVLPLFHVGGLCIQVLPALAVGASVCLHARFDPATWLHDVVAWRPSTSLLVPAVMQALLSHPDWPRANLQSLRFLNSGSSIVPTALIEAFHARGVPMAQVYGSTETGPFSIALPPDQALGRVGQVGWPAPGVQLRLAAADNRPANPGEVGEIQLKAPNLMRGYHRLPAGSGFVEGWFSSGDLGQAGPDGSITVVGRNKDMIISGGENIYPAEIENLAVTWPGVTEAAVVGLPHPRWGEVPVLVLVAQGGQTIDITGLQALMAQRLARYKQPREVRVLDALPRTALGKVQKARLAALLQG
jgi:fatty-acyl-CoA synthase